MRRRVKLLEYACWAAGLACAAASGWAYRAAHPGTQQVLAAVRRDTNPAQTPGATVGLLRIPALGLFVPILEDDDTSSLLQGVGHIPGTALPGGLGTVGLAGHRDTYLRPLAKIRPRMEVEVSRGFALYRYVVDTTEIVHPEEVRVLATVNTPELVLVTCYPFHYIGAAPLRFIVHAHLVSLTPERLDRGGDASPGEP